MQWTRRGWAAGASCIGLLVWLAGCKLVDQTTFGAAPVAPAPDQISAALAANTGVPLVVIRFDGAGVAYDEALRKAVQLAQARRPDAVYDLTTVVPAQGPPDQQISAVTEGEQDATDVMDTMADLGVNPDKMHLAARAEPGLPARELRIYVH